MKIPLLVLKAFSIRVFFVLLAFVLWIAAIRFGMFGADEFSRIVLLRISKPNTLLQVLYGISELSVGIVFFFLLGKHIFPRGIKPLVEEQITLIGSAYYLPSIFALGVIVGLASHGLFLLALPLYR